MVTSSTHGNNTLDKVFCNRPDLFHSSIHKSLLKTKHLAVIVHDVSCGAPSVVSNRRVAVNVFDHRDHNIDRMRRAISLFDWSAVTCVTEISAMYARFVEVLTSLVNTNVPVKVVRLGPRDPPFITPVIKQLLRKRNYLRRRARYLEANSLAEKINLLIIQSRSSNLNKLANANPKQLWAAVKGSVNSGSRSHSSGHPLLNDVHAVNDFFVSISFHSGSQGCPQVTFKPSQSAKVFITDYELKPLLRN